MLRSLVRGGVVRCCPHQRPSGPGLSALRQTALHQHDAGPGAGWYPSPSECVTRPNDAWAQALGFLTKACLHVGLNVLCDENSLNKKVHERKEKEITGNFKRFG